MNLFIRLCKIFALSTLTLLVFLYWRQFGDFQSVVTVAFLIVSAVIWLILAVLFASCYFEKMVIQKKLTKAALGLEEIAAANIRSYKPSGNYVTLQFRSEGVPAEVWEESRLAVQSALNYTILGRIEPAPKDWGVVTFRARRGRPKATKEVLDDQDL